MTYGRLDIVFNLIGLEFEMWMKFSSLGWILETEIVSLFLSVNLKLHSEPHSLLYLTISLTSKQLGLWTDLENNDID